MLVYFFYSEHHPTVAGPMESLLQMKWSNGETQNKPRIKSVTLRKSGHIHRKSFSSYLTDRQLSPAN